MKDGAQFASRQTAELLDRLFTNLERAANDPDEDAVHDLRVSIRRFRAALRVFRPEFKKKAVQDLRELLRPLMDTAGKVRDRDVTAKLLFESGVPSSGNLALALAVERDRARARLKTSVRRLARSASAKKWSRRLGL